MLMRYVSGSIDNIRNMVCSANSLFTACCYPFGYVNIAANKSYFLHIQREQLLHCKIRKIIEILLFVVYLVSVIATHSQKST